MSFSNVTLYLLFFLLCPCTWLHLASATGLAGDPGNDFFEAQIRPLFAKQCYQCHSQRAGEQQGDLSLDESQAWLLGGERGPSVIPGDVDGSLLIQAVRFDDPELQMPPSERLPAADIAKLEQWVRLGAPGPADDTYATEDPADPFAGQSHWAFKPLMDTRPPAVVDHQWPKTDIDRFILSNLERQGLKPSQDAPAEVLARRLSFLVTGMPPTSVHLTGCVDPTPYSDALLSETVDRLLALPQFGERWGRHWLDLARYADSNGLDENFLFREAWRYRNWVIHAINQDMPFDRFLLEQLAGDLLPFDSIEQRDQQRIAAGFMVIGPKVLLGINLQQQRMDIADEHIDTIGRVVLGQTLGCARCHDHKFDPIPTADYYALAGIFSSTQVMESRYMLGQQRLMERLVGLGIEGNNANSAYEEYWREHPALKSRKQNVEAALKALTAADEQSVNELREKHSDAFAQGALDTQQAIEVRIAQQQTLLDELTERLANPPSIPPRAMIPADVEQPADEAIRLAGQYDKTGEVVRRGFLRVLDEQEPSIEPHQSGRIELARWLTDADGRPGQLAARVQANRIWRQLMGRGLVRTVDNFGRTGDLPTHPELLDYLALKLIDSGWSTKSLVREIVLSRCFALSSQLVVDQDSMDPENIGLWRAHRRRLEPEAIRDAMLSAAGQLDESMFESTVAYLGDQATAVGLNKVRRKTDFPCRSIYLPVIRNDLPEVFDAFDFTDPHTATGARSETMVPSRALFMLNDTSVMDIAGATAERILHQFPEHAWPERIERMYWLIVNSPPDNSDRHALQDFIHSRVLTLRNEGLEVQEAELQALSMACHALFASSRFQLLD